MRYLGWHIGGCLGLLLLGTMGAMAQPPVTSADLAESARAVLRSQLAADENMCKLANTWLGTARERRKQGRSLTESLGMVRQYSDLPPNWLPWFEALTVEVYNAKPGLPPPSAGAEEFRCLRAIEQRNAQAIAPPGTEGVTTQAPSPPPQQGPTWVLWLIIDISTTIINASPMQSECQAKAQRFKQPPSPGRFVCLPETVDPRRQR